MALPGLIWDFMQTSNYFLRVHVPTDIKSRFIDKEKKWGVCFSMHPTTIINSQNSVSLHDLCHGVVKRSCLLCVQTRQVFFRFLLKMQIRQFAALLMRVWARR
jgi:hypothetical protein